MNVLELSEQEIIRRNSLNELRAMGIEPYPAAEYVTNAFSTDIKAEFKDDEEPRKVSVSNYRIQKAVSRCISPVMTSARMKTKKCTTLCSNVCWTLVTLSV